MSPLVVYTLLAVVLGDGGATSYSREFRSDQECKTAEAAVHDAAKIAIGVIDVGTLCVRSEFSPRIKPRA